MKKITSLLFCLVSFTAFSQTPITLSRADFPCPSAAACGLPDSVLFTNLPIATNTVNTTLTGANTTWNTLPLKNGTIAYQNFVPMSASPIAFQLLFLGSDYAQPLLGNIGVAGLPVSDAYEYYNYSSSNSRLEIKGMGANITYTGITFPLPAIYSSPDVLYKFPITFGDTDSSVSGFSVTIPPTGTALATIKRNQKRVNEVDGWGSITTPAGTFDVLRVKSSIQRIDSIITALFPLGIPSNIIEYKWLGKTKKIPVFQVTGNVIGTNYTPTAITFWGQDPLGFNDINNQSAVSLYPNPTTDNSTLQYTLNKVSDVDILITNLEGKTVAQFHFKKQASGSHSEIMPLNSLAKGTYIVKCISDNEVISHKLMKF